MYNVFMKISEKQVSRKQYNSNNLLMKYGLSPLQKSVALGMTFEGLSMRKAAARFNVSLSSIVLWVKSPLWVAEVERLVAEFEKDRSRRLQALTAKALDTLEDGVGDVRKVFKGTEREDEVVNDLKDRLRAADSILDRGGMPKTQVSEVNVNKTISFESMVETLTELNSVIKGLESGLDLPPVVDVEIVEDAEDE